MIKQVMQVLYGTLFAVTMLGLPAANAQAQGAYPNRPKSSPNF